MSKDNLLNQNKFHVDPMESTANEIPDFELDVERYRPDIAEFNLTEKQEVELLQTLWSIMRTFVEMGFSHDNCEKLMEIFNETAEFDEENDRLK